MDTLAMLSRMSGANVYAESAAAASTLLATVPAGEFWVVKDALAWHDDPAGATLNWRVYDGFSTLEIMPPVGATAVNVHVSLYPYLDRPLILPPTWAFGIQASGALAAGKKFYLSYQVFKMRGVPAGDWR